MIEVDADDNDVIYTDQENAVALYTRRVTDTSKFPPIFVVALSWHLASMVAGPLIKGDGGAAESKRCSQMAMGWLMKAIESDANQRRSNNDYQPVWISSR